MDHHALARAAAGPNTDTRCWFSYGTVDDEAEGAPSVIFTEEDGSPSKVGPLVRVTLQPSGVPVLCRVATPVAGAGEGFWLPFVAGDEVEVALPQGSERAWPVIVGRTNNGLDVWPDKVCGMDATKNNLAFLRTRAPFALEAGPALMLRSAETGAQLTMAPDASVQLASGDGHMLYLLADVVGLQTSGQEAMVQLDPGAGTAGLYGKGASLLVAEGETKLATPGAVSFATLGTAALAHVTTAESVAGIVYQVLSNIGSTMAGAGPSAASIQAAFASAYGTPGLADTVAGVVSAAAHAGLAGAVAGAVKSGLDAPKDSSNPGLGCKGFLVG